MAGKFWKQSWFPIRQAQPEIAAILRTDKRIVDECARVGAEVE